jgi:hypothetical protein
VNRSRRKDWRFRASVFTAVVSAVLCMLLSNPHTEETAFAQQVASNASDYNSLRDQYLKSWEKLGFQSVFDTYVVGGSVTGYGLYEPKPTSTFSPGETLFLYVEPVGYTFNPIQRGEETLYTFNMTADFIILDSSGKELTSINDMPVSNVVSHHKNTEVFVTLTLSQTQPFPKGDYTIKYIITEKSSGKSFELAKQISIA